MPNVSDSARRSLIICVDWFDPGVRAGGPIRSCVNLITMLGSDYRATVITSNQDLGAPAPYSGIPENSWIAWKGTAAVRYCSGSIQRLWAFVWTLRKRPRSTVYLNSMFSVEGTLFPLLWMWISRSQAQCVLAPRGMLKPSAIKAKSWKKRPLIFLMRITRLCRRVRFHATSHDEVGEIRQAFGDVEVHNVPNVPCQPVATLLPHQKQPGRMKACFVGRIHPIKNPLWLIEQLQYVQGEVQLIMIGPIEDESCYAQCLTAVKQLPPLIDVKFIGPKSHNEIRHLLIQADVFLLPTEGENFGHAIFEALAVGVPVIISDRTLWRNLQNQNAGWDLTIDSPEPFRAALSEMAAMDQFQHEKLRNGGLCIAKNFVKKACFDENYKHLFMHSDEIRTGTKNPLS